MNYKNMTLMELLSVASVDKVTDLEHCLVQKIDEAFFSGDLILTEDACNLSQDNARLDELTRAQQVEIYAMCRHAAILNRCIQSIGDEKEVIKFVGLAQESWISLSAGLVEIIERNEFDGDSDEK